MKYLVVTRHEGIFLTPYLLFPDWDVVICIVDIQNEKCLLKYNWESDDEQPMWQDIDEDHL